MGDKYDEKMEVLRSLGIIKQEPVKVGTMVQRDKLTGSASNHTAEPNIKPGHFFTTGEVDGYDSLASILKMAYFRAAVGKGKERHAEKNQPYHDQDICTEARWLGIGPLVYQIRKKAKEAMRLEGEAKVNELLDVITYAAAGVIVTMEDEEGRYGK